MRPGEDQVGPVELFPTGTIGNTTTCVSSADLPLTGFTAFRDDCNGGDVDIPVNTAILATATSYEYTGLPTGAR